MQLFTDYSSLTFATLTQILICVAEEIVSDSTIRPVDSSPQEHKQSSNFDLSSEENEMRVIKSTRHKHPKNTRTDSDVRECHRGYEDVISKYCCYPGMMEPCYKDDEKQSDARLITEKIRATIRTCCQSSCPLVQLERLCCRSFDCLRRCYGTKLDVNKGSMQFYNLLRKHPKAVTKSV